MLKIVKSWNIESWNKLKCWRVESWENARLNSWNLHFFLTKHWQLKFKTWKIEKARVFENVKCSSVRSKSKGETWKHWIFNMFKLSTCQLMTTPPLTDRNGKFKVETVEKLKRWQLKSWKCWKVENSKVETYI